MLFFGLIFLCLSVTKFISVLLVVCIAAFHVPAVALTPKKSPQDDLKQIQYNYYFRGKYAEAIDALNVFLERGDVDKNLEITAREFLAASYILSGEESKGKDQFLQILNEHEQYAGPDPAKFKAEVVPGDICHRTMTFRENPRLKTELIETFMLLVSLFMNALLQVHIPLRK